MKIPGVFSFGKNLGILLETNIGSVLLEVEYPEMKIVNTLVTGEYKVKGVYKKDGMLWLAQSTGEGRVVCLFDMTKGIISTKWILAKEDNTFVTINSDNDSDSVWACQKNGGVYRIKNRKLLENKSVGNVRICESFFVDGDFIVTYIIGTDCIIHNISKDIIKKIPLPVCNLKHFIEFVSNRN